MKNLMFILTILLCFTTQAMTVKPNQTRIKARQGFNCHDNDSTYTVLIDTLVSKVESCTSTGCNSSEVEFRRAHINGRNLNTNSFYNFSLGETEFQYEISGNKLGIQVLKFNINLMDCDLDPNVGIPTDDGGAGFSGSN